MLNGQLFAPHDVMMNTLKQVVILFNEALIGLRHECVTGNTAIQKLGAVPWAHALKVL